MRLKLVSAFSNYDSTQRQSPLTDYDRCLAGRKLERPLQLAICEINAMVVSRGARMMHAIFMSHDTTRLAPRAPFQVVIRAHKLKKLTELPILSDEVKRLTSAREWHRLSKRISVAWVGFIHY
jgi:hypothetical protein